MCKYSLEHLNSRPARKEDVLLLRAFDTGSRGLISLDDPELPVCIPHGSSLQLELNELDARAWNGGETNCLGTFVTLTDENVPSNWGYYRDGIKIGRETVCLQDFEQDTIVVVNALPEELQLPETTKIDVEREMERLFAGPAPEQQVRQHEVVEA